jgi:putative transposase
VAFPDVFLDATYVKGRIRGRVASRAVVVATGVTATGDREDGAFWTAFYKSLRSRGLAGVDLVISAHPAARLPPGHHG